MSKFNYELLELLIVYLIIISIIGLVIFFMEKFLKFRTLKDNYKFKYKLNLVFLGVNFILGILIIVLTIIKFDYIIEIMYIIISVILTLSFRIYLIYYYKREIFRLTALEKVQEKRRLENN